MAEDKKKEEIAVIEINERIYETKMYEFRGCKSVIRMQIWLKYMDMNLRLLISR